MKIRLWAECLLLFGAMPFALYAVMLTPAAGLPEFFGGFEPRRLLFPLLWVLAAVVMVRWKKANAGQKLFPPINWRYFARRMLARFMLSVLVMFAVVMALAPERLFEFPQERTNVWLIVMIAYPLLSVVPQEVIFRLFFFDRYAPIFGQGWPMIALSGLAFGHVHIIFNNPVAYVMSIAGGVIFSLTYAKTRNLSLVWLEHAIYGQWVFTVGLGWYFYTGAAMSHG